MGLGPVAAIPKALKYAGIGVDDLNLIELNEAFGSQAAYCLRELGSTWTSPMSTAGPSPWATPWAAPAPS